MCVCVYFYQLLSFLPLPSKLSNFSSTRKSTERFPSTSWAEAKLVMRRVGIPRQRSTVKIPNIRLGQFIPLFQPLLLYFFHSFSLFLCLAVTGLLYIWIYLYPHGSDYRLISVMLIRCFFPLWSELLYFRVFMQQWTKCKVHLCRRRQQTPSTGHIWLPWLQPRSTVWESAHYQSIYMELLHQSMAPASGRSTHLCHR